MLKPQLWRSHCVLAKLLGHLLSLINPVLHVEGVVVLSVGDQLLRAHIQTGALVLPETSEVWGGVVEYWLDDVLLVQQQTFVALETRVDYLLSLLCLRLVSWCKWILGASLVSALRQAFHHALAAEASAIVGGGIILNMMSRSGKVTHCLGGGLVCFRLVHCDRVAPSSLMTTHMKRLTRARVVRQHPLLPESQMLSSYISLDYIHIPETRLSLHIELWTEFDILLCLHLILNGHLFMIKHFFGVVIGCQVQQRLHRHIRPLIYHTCLLIPLGIWRYNLTLQPVCVFGVPEVVVFDSLHILDARVVSHFRVQQLRTLYLIYLLFDKRLEFIPWLSGAVHTWRVITFLKLVSGRSVCTTCILPWWSFIWICCVFRVERQLWRILFWLGVVLFFKKSAYRITRHHNIKVCRWWLICMSSCALSLICLLMLCDLAYLVDIVFLL